MKGEFIGWPAHSQGTILQAKATAKRLSEKQAQKAKEEKASRREERTSLPVGSDGRPGRAGSLRLKEPRVYHNQINT